MSMDTSTLIPGSVTQQFELDFKSFSEYNQAIWRVYGKDNRLAEPTADKNAAFKHINDLQAQLAAGNAQVGGARVGFAEDTAFFAIKNVRLMLAAVNDKANRMPSNSMLLEWEDVNIARASTTISSINAQLDVQHEHRVAIFTRLDSQSNDCLIRTVAPGSQGVITATEASVLIGGTQFPSPALRLTSGVGEDAMRAYLLYVDAHFGAN